MANNSNSSFLDWIKQQHQAQPKPGGIIPVAQTPVMSKATLEAIIAGVENNPLAGQGTFTKKDLLIDALLAHWNVCGGGKVRETTAILTEAQVKP